jgi:WD40 repeat protein
MEAKPSFDIFLSHNSKDKTTVEAIAQRLEDDESLRTWLDRWNLIPGEPWQEAIEQALDASRTCAVFLGPGGLGPWENEEMRAALSTRVRHHEFRVIPVLLPGAILPEPGKLPLFLSRLTWVDLRSGLTDQREFRRLVAGIRGTAPGRDHKATLNSSRTECPYRGLEVFEEEHAPFFFGRESMTQHILEGLVDNRFLAVLGSSGSGKSSLVRAGVIPKLKSGGLPGSDKWIYITMTPGAHPLNELAFALTETDPNARSVEHIRGLLDNLESDERAFHLYARLSLSQKPKNSFLFLFVDQFEELMTLCRDDEEREQFLLNLRYASTLSGGRIIIMITMRADFMARAAVHRNLAEMLSGHQFVVSPMDDMDLRRAIEEPATLVGMSFEHGLVDRILEDTGQESGVLPLLEDMLLQLCQKRDSEGVVTQQAYQELGGVHGSLAKRAEELYEALSLEEQDIARRVLLRLTQPGEGVEDTRRRAEVAELWPDAAHQADVERVIEKLVKARLLIMSSPTAEERTVNVAHEALIRGWPRLRGWIDTEREGIRIHRRITETAREWRSRNQDAGFLYRGSRLAEAQEWRSKHESSLNELERQFLDTSHEVQQLEHRAVRVRRWVVIGVLSLALVAVGLYAIKLYKDAIKSSRDQKVATSRQLAVSAMAKVKKDPRKATQLAMEAYSSYPSQEAENALRRALSGFQESREFRVHADKVYLPGSSSDYIPPVFTAEFSPNGDKIVTASDDHLALIWDARTFEVLQVLRGHDKRVMSAVFSHDGNQVVTSSEDKTARIWDVQTGKLIVVLSGDNGHGSILYWATFSRNGSRVVTASGDTTARIWDAHNGNLLGVLHHKLDDAPPEISDKSAVVSTTFSPDGTEVITGTNDGKVHVWNVHTGQESIIPTSRQGKPIHGASVNVIAFNRDGDKFITGSTDGTALIWDAKTKKPLNPVLIGHAGRIYGAAFSPDGKYVATASTDRTAKIWDAHTGKELSELRGHSHWVYTAAFSPDSSQIVTASRDGTARIWRVPDERKLFELSDSTAKILGAAFSPSRTKVVTTNEDETARIWDGHNPAIVLRGHKGTVKSAMFSPDEKLVVTAGEDKTARIWSAETGELIGSGVLHHKEKVVSAIFSPDGKKVVTGSQEDYAVRVWDAKTGQEQLPPLQGHTDAVYAAVFSPDGNTVVTTSGDQTARVWNWKSNETLKELLGHRDAVLTASFSLDGKQVVTGSRDHTALVWDLSTGDPVTELTGHNDSVVSVAFRPDGKFVATTSLDGTVRIWDASTGNELLRWGQNGGVFAVAWSDDQKHVIAVGEDRIVRSYDCEECGSAEDLVKLAQARNAGQMTPEELSHYLQ